jgi:hypothetical protein
MPARADRFSMMAYSSGACWGVTGCARYMRSTMLSLQKKAEKFMTTASPSAIVSPVRPPTDWPIRSRSPVSAASRTVVFRKFIATSLSRAAAGRPLQRCTQDPRPEFEPPPRAALTHPGAAHIVHKVMESRVFGTSVARASASWRPYAWHHRYHT